MNFETVDSRGSAVEIRMHPSVLAGDLSASVWAALEERRLPSAFLYQGFHAAHLWERLHLAYAPSAREVPSDSIHRKAMQAWIAKGLSGSVPLVSLGCGLAEKEFCGFELKGETPCRLDLIDASAELVAEAKRRACRYLPERNISATVADLSQVSQWRDLIRGRVDHCVFTLFGMVPNFDPALLTDRLDQVLEKGDWLMVDANMIPDEWGGERTRDEVIPQSIVDQYDNDESREWLMAALASLGIYGTNGNLGFETVDGSEGHLPPRIRASFTFTDDLRISVSGKAFTFQAGEALEVFYSIRHRRDTVLRFLDGVGVRVEGSWYSNRGEDGVFLCRRVE